MRDIQFLEKISVTYLVWLSVQVHILLIRKFSRRFYFRETLHMRSLWKLNPRKICEIILSFTDIGNADIPSKSRFQIFDIGLHTL